MPLDHETSQLSDELETKGFANRIDVLTEREAFEVQQRFKVFEAKFGKKYTQYSLHNVHIEYEWVLRLATHPQILNPLKRVLGDDLILLDSRFICKYPSQDFNEACYEDKYVAWHQDVRYWGIEGDVISVWLAIDDADVDNGCMIVIPGTHNRGIFEHQTAHVKGNMLTSNQEIPPHLFDMISAVPCPLKVGQMSLHHGHLVHGSQANRSKRRRCGFVIRFVSTSSEPINDPARPRKFEATVLVSGKDEFNNFTDYRPVWFNWRQ